MARYKSSVAIFDYSLMQWVGLHDYTRIFHAKNRWEALTASRNFLKKKRPRFYSAFHPESIEIHVKCLDTK